MGNVEFGFKDESNEVVGPSGDSREQITTAARLLGVDLAKLVGALTSKRQVIAGDVIDSNLTID